MKHHKVYGRYSSQTMKSSPLARDRLKYYDSNMIITYSEGIQLFSPEVFDGKRLSKKLFGPSSRLNYEKYICDTSLLQSVPLNPTTIKTITGITTNTPRLSRSSSFSSPWSSLETIIEFLSRYRWIHNPLFER